MKAHGLRAGPELGVHGEHDHRLGIEFGPEDCRGKVKRAQGPDDGGKCLCRATASVRSLSIPPRFRDPPSQPRAFSAPTPHAAATAFAPPAWLHKDYAEEKQIPKLMSIFPGGREMASETSA